MAVRHRTLGGWQRFDDDDGGDCECDLVMLGDEGGITCSLDV